VASPTGPGAIAPRTGPEAPEFAAARGIDEGVDREAPGEAFLVDRVERAYAVGEEARIGRREGGVDRRRLEAVDDVPGDAVDAGLCGHGKLVAHREGGGEASPGDGEKAPAVRTG
jgi:hypothetical protein